MTFFNAAGLFLAEHLPFVPTLLALGLTAAFIYAASLFPEN
jgi:hypothetical protein